MNPVFEFAHVLFEYCRQQQIAILLTRPYVHAADFANKDLDILVRDPKDIPRLLAWLQNIRDLYVVARFKRSDGISVSLFGLGESKDRTISIDFIDSLSWKGIPYLNNNEVFERAVTAGRMTRFDPVDQLVYLLMLHGCKHNGHKLDAYHDFLRTALTRHRADVTEKLVGLFGYQRTLQLDEAMANADYTLFNQSLLGGYFYHAWLRNGLAAAASGVRYFLRQIWLRLNAPKTLLAVYGVDGAGKSTLLKVFQRKFASFGHKVTVVHFMPPWPWRPTANTDQPQSNPHAHAPRPLAVSMLKLCYYLCRYWLFYLWPRRGEVMFVFDRYLPDCLVDPKRFRYRGPMAVLEFFMSLLPREDMRVLVDIAAKDANQRKPELPLHEVVRQAAEYRKFVTTYPVHMVISGEGSLSANAHALATQVALVLDGKHSHDMV